MTSGIKNKFIDFSDMSGGKNSAFPRHALAENQVAETINAIHHPIGTSRAPGYTGLAATALFTKPIRGMFTFIKDDGTEILIAVSDSKLYYVDLSAATKTEICVGLITADTECYAVNAGGKLWIVNGTDFIKVESSAVAYRVQIVAPAGITGVVTDAGGSLAAGVYGCYGAYARKNAAGQYLYSLPFSIGNKTCAGGSSLITFTVPTSSDPQVTHKVIFMTNADGAVPYYYGEVTNATATIVVSSTANRNTGSTGIMSTVSAANQILPITPSGIYTYDDKLFVWDINDRTVYWSLKTDVNPFDMERFLAENFRTLSYTVNAMFSVGVDLFFNHLGNGTSKAISGDMSSVIKRTQKGLWFLDCKTQEGKSNVVFYKGFAFGLTNDGFRMFDGEQFSDDLSFHIKPDIDIVYNGISTTYLPCAIVNRRSGKRTEYRFSYRNTGYGSGCNNDQLVFNLDFFFDPNNQKKTWECWETGFNAMAIVSNNFYGGQSVNDGAQVVRESGVSDVNCYDRTGTFNTVIFKKQIYLFSRTIIDALDAELIGGPPYALATSGGTINGSLVFFDRNNARYPFTIQGISPTKAILPSESSGLGLELPFIMNPQYPLMTCDPVAFAARGNSVAVEISQVEDDDEFFLYKLQLPRAKEVRNNLT
jgi:hypothetical protein